ncbi:hypothetical protein HDV03_003653 [Kappamyces sp. JEL0829]|nr:hypothetical protein HDV03_003653 [Kappamyces sp. JEL0829]
MSGDLQMNEDEIRLAALGYKQGLRRQFSFVETFGVVLLNASFIIGVVPLYGTAMYLGGPATFTWGWLLTSLFTVCIGLSLAEICSTFPTAGGLYFYSAKLAGPDYGPFASFFTAWFNALGQMAGCSGSVYAGATYFNIFLALLFPSFQLTAQNNFITFFVMMVTAGLLNTVGGPALKASSYVSVFLHTVGIAFMVAALLIMAPTKQSSAFVFGQFIDGTGWSTDMGASPALVFMLGLLPSAWSLIGYDASAHMSEETHSAHLNGPRAIIYTIGTAVVMGWGMILTLNYTIQDFAAESVPQLGSIPAQIMVDCCGTVVGAVLIFEVALAGFMCGVGTIASNSRMLYAFARDHGLPFSPTLVVLDKRTGMPLRLVWVSTFFCTLLSVPALFSSIVLNAVSGISIIGFTVSYAIPIFIRITLASKTFVQSEFNLGRYSIPVGWASVLWTVFLFCIFQLPNGAPAFPITTANFNFVPVVVGCLLLFTGCYWQFSAKHWFRGPVKEVSEKAQSDK